MDFIMLVLRISAGLTVVYGLKIGVSYYFGDSEKGGKFNDFIGKKMRNH